MAKVVRENSKLQNLAEAHIHIANFEQEGGAVGDSLGDDGPRRASRGAAHIPIKSYSYLTPT